MSDLSLQRTEAEARRALLSISAYDVVLDLARDAATFGSTTTIRFDSQGGGTFLDLKPAALRRISLNGADLDVALLDRGRFPLETAPGHNELVVEATMRFRNDGEGLHRATDPADGRDYVYGMSFMDAAPSVFACFDQPDLKAPYTFHVTAPQDWTVVGNGAETLVDGVWELATTEPLSTYFVTIVAGPYHVVSDEHDGIALRLLARASKAGALEGQAAEILQITKDSFDEYHRLFGIRYPFGKYDQAFVPDFNAGAMENPGCITIRDTYLFDSRPTLGAQIFRAEIIAHEMAHQWFGNLVTPVWWDDLWLNESFAEYMGVRVTATVTDYDAWADLSYARRQWGLVADQRPSTHPVAGTGATDAVAALQDFDGISYAKGSAVLRQLATTLGDEVFLAGVIDHFESHRFGNATMADLFASWGRAGAGDLTGFADAWLRTAGPDRIAWDGTTITRTPPADHPAERSHTFRIAVHGSDGWRTDTVTVAGPTSYTPGGDAVVLDPYDDTWAALVPDPGTVQALKTLLPGITDDGLRAGVWNNLRTGLHNAVVDPADIVDIVVAALPVEDAETSARRTLSWLTSMVLPLSPAGSTERVHAAALAALAGEEQGSERQLAALRYAVVTADDAGELRTWLATPPPGIEVDSELRWSLLARLAGLGAIDRAELQQAYDAAPTADAKVSLVRCLASLPDAEAKAYAWSIFTGATAASNYELAAAGDGMWQGGQEELTTPYVDRYFADLPATSSVRSGWSLADSADAFFPRTSVRESTLAAAQTLAADTTLDAALRRRLSDAADQLARRLAVRAAHGE